jgi:hypothetical protein
MTPTPKSLHPREMMKILLAVWRLESNDMAKNWLRLPRIARAARKIRMKSISSLSSSL